MPYALPEKEPILEPLLRKLRIGRIVPLLKMHKDCVLLDIGCGFNAQFLRDVEQFIELGIGIDFKAPEIQTERIRTQRAVLTDTLPFADASFDVVTMLAVLEHLENPDAVSAEVFRVLRPGGVFTGTVPSKAAKPVLEFLSFKLGIVSRAEIEDHKYYYDRRSLFDLLNKAGFTNPQHSYFQLGMNNFFSAEKVTLKIE